MACLRCELAVAELLIGKGADLEAKDTVRRGEVAGGDAMSSSGHALTNRASVI
jgi:uncharacterized cupin superfamily protein